MLYFIELERYETATGEQENWPHPLQLTIYGDLARAGMESSLQGIEGEGELVG